MKQFFTPQILSDHKTTDYQEFKRRHSQVLEGLIQRLNQIREGAGKELQICLEGGHIYTDEHIEPFHLSQLEALGHTRHFLSERGFIKISQMLFIDNFHPKKNNTQEIFDLEQYKNITAYFADPFDKVAWEADFKDLALGHIKYIRRTMPNILINNNAGVVLNVRGKPLLQHNDGDPTCAMLDSALTINKLEEADFVVNILPASEGNYKEQQKKLKAIVAHIRQEHPNTIPLTSIIV